MSPLLRVCPVSGCGELTTRGRCDKHHAEAASRREAVRRIYSHRRWRQVTRPAVLERDGHRCRYCGNPAPAGQALDVAHIRPTHELLAAGADVFDPDLCVAAHRRCHNANAPHLVDGGVLSSQTTHRLARARHARETSTANAAKPPGRPALTLLERVQLGRFRPGRHAELLLLEPLPKQPPERWDRRAWRRLVEWQDWYRAYADMPDQQVAVAHEFSRIVRYLHGGRRPAVLDWGS